MISEIYHEEEPKTVIIYERPELKDAISWFIMILLFSLILVVGIYLTNPDFVVIAILISTVVFLPFFVNRFLLKKDSIGGESLRIIRIGENITYKSRIFEISNIQFEYIITKMTYGYNFQLYLISNEDEELKIRSDYSNSIETSITDKLQESLSNFLGLKIHKIER